MTQTIADIMKAHAIRIDSVFVPYSQSRNAGQPYHKANLNWTVTLVCNERPLLSTDYSAGIAHAPCYKSKLLERFARGGGLTLATEGIVKMEVETGRAAVFVAGMWRDHMRGASIKPNSEDVMASIIMDCDVLNYRSFEDWADSFGYDTDSRKAFAIHQTCLEMALKVRNGLSDEAYQALVIAAQNY